MLKRMFAPLLALKGNPRYAVFTEPLWGIPWNLYAPFFTLFMFSLGLGDADIGVLLTVGLIIQMIAGIFGGVLADKFGRRKTNIIWDNLAWTVPCLVWAFAQDFRWFLVAAIFNALWPIGANAWECLLVEDAEPKSITQIYNWIYVGGVLAAFMAPISALLIRDFDFIMVMRVLFIFSAILMAAKFAIHIYFATETGQGVIRIKETADTPIWKLIVQYKSVLWQIFTTPATLRVLLLMIFLQIQHLVAGSFFPLLVTQDLGLPVYRLAWFTVLRGGVMLVFFLLLQRVLNRFSIYWVMILGLILYIGAYILLIFTPVGFLLPLLVFTVVDASAAALFMPRRDTLVFNNVDPAERSRIRSMMTVIVLGAASPFGIIIGRISEHNRQIPFMVAIGLFVIIGVIVLIERWKNNASDGSATA